MCMEEQPKQILLYTCMIPPQQVWARGKGRTSSHTPLPSSAPSTCPPCLARRGQSGAQHGSITVSLKIQTDPLPKGNNIWDITETIMYARSRKETFNCYGEYNKRKIDGNKNMNLLRQVQVPSCILGIRNLEGHRNDSRGNSGQ